MWTWYMSFLTLEHASQNDQFYNFILKFLVHVIFLLRNNVMTFAGIVKEII